MNCHTQVKNDSPRLELVRQSYATGEPIPGCKFIAYPTTSILITRRTSRPA